MEGLYFRGGGLGCEPGTWYAGEKVTLAEESMFVALQGQGDGGKLNQEHKSEKNCPELLNCFFQTL